jgi:hypothetical protein
MLARPSTTAELTLEKHGSFRHLLDFDALACPLL